MKKTGKHLLAGILACLLLCALAACGGSETAENTVSPSGTVSVEPSGTAEPEGSGEPEDIEEPEETAGSEDPEEVIGPNENVARPSTSGALSVKGTQLTDSNGDPVQLRGVSTHGLAWYPVGNGCSPEAGDPPSADLPGAGGRMTAGPGILQSDVRDMRGTGS